MSYGKVHEEYWEGEKIAPLSDRAALLGLYLIAGSHRNAIGCFKLGIGAITDIERFGKWGIEGVSIALREMINTGFIVRDERTGWTLIVNALVKDPIKGAKAAIHAAKLAAAVPANSPVYSRLKTLLEPQLETEKQHLSKAEGWPMREPQNTPSIPHTIPQASPSPLPEPSPEPEPQPEPSEANASGAVAPPSVTRETKQPELVPASKPAEPVTEPDIPLCLVRIDNGDYAKALFRNGLAFVAEQLGKPPAECRALMGRWLKACGDDHKRLFGILADAQRDGRADLRSWVPKAIEAKSGAAGAVADDALSPTVRDIIARQKAERGAA